MLKYNFNLCIYFFRGSEVEAPALGSPLGSRSEQSGGQTTIRVEDNSLEKSVLEETISEERGKSSVDQEGSRGVSESGVGESASSADQRAPTGSMPRQDREGVSIFCIY